MKRLRTYLSVLFIICLSWRAEAQTLTYSFIDPCTKQVTYFSVPATGTVIYFYGQSRSFVPGDVQNGTLAAWINQVYADYRKISPCGQQQGQITQNQITSQVISSTVQSVVGSLMATAQSTAGGDDAASKGKTESDKKNKKNGNKNNNTTDNNQTSQSNTTGTGNASIGSGGSDNTGGSGSDNSNNNSNASGGESSKNTKEKGEEVAATTTMNVDARQERGSEGGGKGGGKNGNARSNPIIVQSDLTTAQNLDKTFTPILNLGMAQSSMTGMSSWGATSMIWLNFKQFALSSRYTKIHFNRSGSLKFIHNFNLTGVYTYGNVLAFAGYSGIINAGKWGITGFNISVAGTLITEEDNTYLSPSITAFYTKPLKANKRLTISPELYVISTPLIYSSKEKVTTTDRYFSMFLGSGFDYQITKRFKFNINYKANLSTNPEFPILSFVLVGSKINL